MKENCCNSARSGTRVSNIRTEFKKITWNGRSYRDHVMKDVCLYQPSQSRKKIILWCGIQRVAHYELEFEWQHVPCFPPNWLIVQKVVLFDVDMRQTLHTELVTNFHWWYRKSVAVIILLLFMLLYFYCMPNASFAGLLQFKRNHILKCWWNLDTVVVCILFNLNNYRFI